jgi:hypothetical protein
MPVQALHDVTDRPPRAVESPFELAGRRLADRCLAAGRVAVDERDLRMAIDFLRRFGIAVEAGPGADLRILSAASRATVVTREAVLVLALRCLARLHGPRPATRSAHAA